VSNNLSGKTKLFNSIRNIFKVSPIEKCLVTLSQGKSPASFIGKLLPSHYLYGRGSHKMVNRYGLNFNLDISDLVDWSLYFGLKETAHEKLYALCRENYIVMDIGTNNGAVLMQLSQKAKEGFVYGFEPDPINYARCIKNLSLNKLANVEVNNIALGSEKGQAALVIVDETNLGMNKISIDPSHKSSEVFINTLDNFVAEKGLSKVDLIKIDTEGFELHVLTGSSEILKNMKPVLFIELDDNNLKVQGQSAKQLVEYLEALKYKIKRADTDCEITGSYNFTNCHFDIIAQ